MPSECLYDAASVCFLAPAVEQTLQDKVCHIGQAL